MLILFLPDCLPPPHIFYSNILAVLMFAVILYLHRVYEQNNISDKLFQTFVCSFKQMKLHLC